jgi:hypothetical protein
MNTIRFYYPLLEYLSLLDTKDAQLSVIRSHLLSEVFACLEYLSVHVDTSDITLELIEFTSNLARRMRLVTEDNLDTPFICSKLVKQYLKLSNDDKNKVEIKITELLLENILISIEHSLELSRFLHPLYIMVMWIKNPSIMTMVNAVLLYCLWCPILFDDALSVLKILKTTLGKCQDLMIIKLSIPTIVHALPYMSKRSDLAKFYQEYLSRSLTKQDEVLFFILLIYRLKA